ncbi:NAD(P)/FAD-dependent oxidoreductase [Sporosarcina limicola]|uniref:Flavin-dependent dehydrogenase n=1 Tax=Sporosarcina limicola TaxID=34101 RepID=A0A927MK95_9BACL|nr:NAD(P)/FAD-dependent oxidoreductase [Sporosarcina limicola]MBE1555426.1 flavin-dependent dehydrogenase [Sporosarcina limicola]
MRMEKYDVVIIGAGLSGSSTAIRLLQQGIKPLVIEKAKFPRAIVGEGLSPICNIYLKELDVYDEIYNGNFFKKNSLQIIAPSGGKAYTQVDFKKKEYQDGNHAFNWGYNVKRIDFDMVFFNKAKSMGAEIREEHTLRDIILGEKDEVTGIIVRDNQNEDILIETKLVIDCSGRSSIFASKLQLRDKLDHVFDGQWANFAVRCYFENLNLEPLIKDNPNYHKGTVNMLPFSDCWYWIIPLEDNLTSIGFVARSKMNDIFAGYDDKLLAYRDLMSKHPVLKEVIEGANMLDSVAVTSRLGHMNKQMSGPGYLCVGDSAFFADPAWATGMTIGLKSSKLAAEVAVEACKKQDFSKEFLNRYEEVYRTYLENPVNSIRAYNYYYNDVDYVEFLVDRLAKNPSEMDLMGAILFEYANHTQFRDWTFRAYKAYVKETGKIPQMDKVSQFDFEQGINKTVQSI